MATVSAGQCQTVTIAKSAQARHVPSVYLIGPHNAACLGRKNPTIDGKLPVIKDVHFCDYHQDYFFGLVWEK